MKRISLLVSMVLIATMVLSACGGGGGAGGAASAAKAWFDAFAQLDMNKMKDLTCDKEKATIEQALSFLSGTGGNTDTQALKDLFKFDVSGLKFEEKSSSGGNAVVVVSGKIKVEAFGQSQEQDVNNEELPVVTEGGVWKVCAASLPGN